ncbi:hypothetical protein L1887_53521 [Cichorium endivia]|nr:hypothetical protein L1887_53521 [Cichorium endivia]
MGSAHFQSPPLTQPFLSPLQSQGLTDGCKAWAPESQNRSSGSSQSSTAKLCVEQLATESAPSLDRSSNAKVRLSSDSTGLPGFALVGPKVAGYARVQRRCA